jgi:hypothetical protein
MMRIRMSSGNPHSAKSSSTTKSSFGVAMCALVVVVGRRYVHVVLVHGNGNAYVALGFNGGCNHCSIVTIIFGTSQTLKKGFVIR